jgi:hypothetical protein
MQSNLISNRIMRFRYTTNYMKFDNSSHFLTYT